MKLLVHTLILTAVAMAIPVFGQIPYSGNATYESAAASLRSASPRQYNFSKAVMSDVMRLMAEDAGISFFGLPDAGDGKERMVTFTINAAPFTALETLAKANGVTLIHEQGIWYLRPANDRELIGRIYKINYNAQEAVRKNSQGGGISGGGGGGGGAGGGGAGGGISLQGSPDFFEVEPSRLLEDIRGILDIQTTGGVATIAPTASVDTLAQLSLRGLAPTPGIVSSPYSAAGADDASQAKVIWNSDSNTLYVVASRQQHQWIEAYLSSADREQNLIAVEVKFLETSRDPNLDLGINWTGALGSNGAGLNLATNTSELDWGNLGNSSLPTAVLSYNDLNLRLSALYSDSKTRSVSYPRMVTLDNREVAFRSVVNQPVLSSSASASLGAGATSTSSVEYIPIGTVINVLPKTMNNGKILLNVSVTVSDIVGTEVINGNPFPIASSRVYTAPLTVKSGYTVAISGLDSANSSHVESGVPFFGNIPVVGKAFKFKRQNKSRQHLMMLITPVIINGCGVTKKPITKDPWCGPCATASPVAHPAIATPVKSAPSFSNTRASSARNRNYSQARKSNFAFGKKKANVSENAYASSAPVGNAVPILNTPVSDSAPTRVSPPSNPSLAANSNDSNPEIARINQSINRLRADLDQSAGDRQKINNVVSKSKTLLSQIEAMRGSDTTSMTGELGDTWWNVIKLKTDAVKLSRE